jgi:LPS-assembly protein
MVLYSTDVSDLNPFPPAARVPPAPEGLRLRAGLAGWLGLSVLGSVVMAWPLSAAAQGTAAQPMAGWSPLRLQPSEVLQERLPEAVKNQAPTHFFGDQLGGKTGVSTVLEGNAELRRHDMVVRADRMEHVEATDTATATGNVRINRLGDIFEGPELQLKLDTFEGYFTNPRFSLLRNGGQGEAERMEFRGEDLSVAFRASYTTCARPAGPAGENWEPDWTVTASRIEFDNVEETGTATNGVLRFKGVPLLASPYVSFPLSDRRKSGVLPPTINIDSQSGLELTLPYYLNLAPNRDATLYPTLMSKRGIDLGGEFRYLERNYAGTFRGAYMPSDRLRNGEDRWAASLQHSQALGPIAGRGGSSISLNLNRVSDDNYWRDFPRSSTTLTERLLPSDAAFSWGSGNWSLAAGAYTWQTLQDVDAPITPPYDRVPSLTLRYAPQSRLSEGVLPGTAWSLEGDLTRFERSLQAAPNSFDGTRAYLLARASHTWLAPAWSLTPAVQLHVRRYQFDAAAAPFARDTNVAIPTFTVDGNLFLRARSLFLRARLHTDAGAAPVLRLHAVPRPEQPAGVRHIGLRLQPCHHLQRQPLWRPGPHSRCQRRHHRGHLAAAGPRNWRRGAQRGCGPALPFLRPAGHAARHPARRGIPERHSGGRAHQLEPALVHQRHPCSSTPTRANLCGPHWGRATTRATTACSTPPTAFSAM